VLGRVPLEGVPLEPLGRWATVAKQKLKIEANASVERMMELFMNAPLFSGPETLA